MQSTVIALLSDCLALPTPKKTADFDEAQSSVSPSAFRDQWKLAEGFVASEGNDILPHLAKARYDAEYLSHLSLFPILIHYRRPNLVDNHRSLLLLCLVKTNLADALIRVVAEAEPELAVQATVFLGQFLHATSKLLPTELGLGSQCLANLLAQVSSSDYER